VGRREATKRLALLFGMESESLDAFASPNEMSCHVVSATSRFIGKVTKGVMQNPKTHATKMNFHECRFKSIKRSVFGSARIPEIAKNDHSESP
jgi:hypothetical protein